MLLVFLYLLLPALLHWAAFSQEGTGINTKMKETTCKVCDLVLNVLAMVVGIHSFRLHIEVASDI